MVSYPITIPVMLDSITGIVIGKIVVVVVASSAKQEKNRVSDQGTSNVCSINRQKNGTQWIDKKKLDSTRTATLPY